MRQVNPVRGERQFGKLTLRHGSQCFAAAQTARRGPDSQGRDCAFASPRPRPRRISLSGSPMIQEV
jgi:hypothetical protein